MLKKYYEVVKPFRSCGITYWNGTRFTQEEIINPRIIRLFKVKITEGYIIPLFLEEENQVKENPTIETQPSVEETPKPKRKYKKKKSTKK